ncbi:MAG: hypothetical protein ACKVP7_25460 [Hyphomicrobiaceae bacterium]
MSVEQHLAGGPAQPSEFIEGLIINQGPRELLAKYFLLADKQLRERGVILTLASFDELLAVNAANRDSWLPLTPTFDISKNKLSSERSFCLIGRDLQNRSVATHAGRLFDWQSTSFAEEGEALRLFYDHPQTNALPGEMCRVSSNAARRLTGLVSYTGAVWYRRDYRGLGLAFYMSRLVRAYAYALWGVDYSTGMIAAGNVAKGLTDKTGHANVEMGLHSRGSTHGDVDYQIIWSTPRQIVEQLTQVLADESKTLILDQRRAQ